MSDWLEELASALAVDALSHEETGAVLKLARDVAHGVERKFAPLSTYLLGVAVGNSVGSGSRRSEAFRDAMGRARPTVPPPAEDIGARPDPRGG
jgi:hypothetical protein